MFVVFLSQIATVDTSLVKTMAQSKSAIIEISDTKYNNTNFPWYRTQNVTNHDRNISRIRVPHKSTKKMIQQRINVDKIPIRGKKYDIPVLFSINDQTLLANITFDYQHAKDGRPRSGLLQQVPHDDLTSIVIGQQLYIRQLHKDDSQQLPLKATSSSSSSTSSKTSSCSSSSSSVGITPAMVAQSAFFKNQDQLMLDHPPPLWMLDEDGDDAGNNNSGSSSSSNSSSSSSSNRSSIVNEYNSSDIIPAISVSASFSSTSISASIPTSIPTSKPTSSLSKKRKRVPNGADVLGSMVKIPYKGIFDTIHYKEAIVKKYDSKREKPFQLDKKNGNNKWYTYAELVEFNIISPKKKISSPSNNITRYLPSVHSNNAVVEKQTGANVQLQQQQIIVIDDSSEEEKDENDVDGKVKSLPSTPIQSDQDSENESEEQIQEINNDHVNPNDISSNSISSSSSSFSSSTTSNEDATECLCCYEDWSEVIKRACFIDCRHAKCCYKCAMLIFEHEDSNKRNCPECRKPILQKPLCLDDMFT